MMLNTIQMEYRLADYFNFRQNIIVPNICWGMHIHECDLFIVSKSGYVTEVEIKISKQDLVNDKKKRHGHQHAIIKKLYFAIPESLTDYQIHIPARAGIIILAEKQIYVNGFRKGIRISREPFVNQSCRKLSEKEMQKVLWLGVMRVWSLKKKLIKIAYREDY